MTILEVLISQTKVGNFANKVVIKKNITSCQVSMDYLKKDIILHCEYVNAFQKVKKSFSFQSERENINLTRSQHLFLVF